jgi:SET domain-containing protein
MQTPEIRLTPAFCTLVRDSEATPLPLNARQTGIARINHSCLPNADHAIDWATLQMTVYATSAIKTGDEINIEYQASLVERRRPHN